MDIVIDNGAESILKTLENSGFSAYITGSAVRDFLMDRPITSVHISTSAEPIQIARLFPDHISINHRTQTVTVAKNQIGYEISSFKHLQSIGIRKPDVYDDLSLSGFTIDAIAYNPSEKFLDFFGGVDDIKRKTVRCVCEPDSYFAQSPSEMLRAIRLCVTLGFFLDINTEKAIRKYSVYSKQIPYFIQLEEFNKILMSSNPEQGFMLLHELGLLKHLLPQLDVCFSVPQKNKYHIYNVGEHIMHALKNTPTDLTLRWAALLHDIGKPKCSSRDANGIIHFYGHHRESMKIADKILNFLHLDRNIVHEILLLVEYHDVRIEPSLPAIKRLLSKIGNVLFEKLLTLQEADCKAKNPAYVHEKLEKTKVLRTLFHTIIEEHQPYKISDLAINSRDLIKLKYRAGRQITDTLKVLLEDVILNPALNNYDYLINKAKNLRK